MKEVLRQSRGADAPPITKPQLYLKPLAQNWMVGGHQADVFCVRFSSDSTLVAAGLGNGQVCVYQALAGRLAYTLDTSESQLPSTAMRFRPSSALATTKNVLLTANADGQVQHWHVTSGKCLHTIHEPDNQVFAIDYKEDGSQFATAGRDYTVRIYDEATKTKICDLCSGFGKKQSGHSNRVFSLRFHPTDENVLLSAGWDNTIQIWDLRIEGAVRSIFGPHICGDSVDISGEKSYHTLDSLTATAACLFIH
ncbi:WD40-repeat-containing domain protein [Pavlovales sp. CCMP2436]|nr:WD40-repeat-containing domain protein [Pavlovales sp. CCMP2436]